MVFKELADDLGGIFAHIFQLPLDKGDIPKDWSLANVFPLFNKGERVLASNYFPVPLTSIPHKLLEHAVCSNIMGHLEEYSMVF